MSWTIWPLVRTALLCDRTNHNLNLCAIIYLFPWARKNRTDVRTQSQPGISKCCACEKNLIIFYSILNGKAIIRLNYFINNFTDGAPVVWAGTLEPKRARAPSNQLQDSRRDVQVAQLLCSRFLYINQAVSGVLMLLQLFINWGLSGAFIFFPFLV